MRVKRILSTAVMFLAFVLIAVACTTFIGYGKVSTVSAAKEVVSTYQKTFDSSVISSDFSLFYQATKGASSEPNDINNSKNAPVYWSVSGGVLQCNGSSSYIYKEKEAEGALIMSTNKKYTNFHLTVDYKMGTMTYYWPVIAVRQLQQGKVFNQDGIGVFVQQEGLATIWGDGDAGGPYESSPVNDYYGVKNEWHTIEIDMYGTICIIKVDNNPIFNYSFPVTMFRSGYISLMAINNNAAFRNLKIEEYNVERVDASANRNPVGADTATPDTDTNISIDNNAIYVPGGIDEFVYNTDNSAITLNPGESYTLNGITFANPTTGNGQAISLSRNMTTGAVTVDVPAGEDVSTTKDSVTKLYTNASSSEAMQLSVDSAAVATLNAGTVKVANDTVVIVNGDKFVSAEDGVQLKALASGAEIVSGKVKIESGSKYKYNDIKVTNTSEAGFVTLDKTSSGLNVIMPEGQKAGFVDASNNEYEYVSVGSSDLSVNVSSTGAITPTGSYAINLTVGSITIATGIDVTVNGKTFTTASSDTCIEKQAENTALKSGSVVVAAGNTIYINDIPLTNTGASGVTMAKTTAGATLTIAKDGSVEIPDADGNMLPYVNAGTSSLKVNVASDKSIELVDGSVKLAFGMAISAEGSNFLAYDDNTVLTMSADGAVLESGSVLLSADGSVVLGSSILYNLTQGSEDAITVNASTSKVEIPVGSTLGIYDASADKVITYKSVDTTNSLVLTIKNDGSVSFEAGKMEASNGARVYGGTIYYDCVADGTVLNRLASAIQLEEGSVLLLKGTQISVGDLFIGNPSGGTTPVKLESDGTQTKATIPGNHYVQVKGAITKIYGNGHATNDLIIIIKADGSVEVVQGTWFIHGEPGSGGTVGGGDQPGGDQPGGDEQPDDNVEQGWSGCGCGVVFDVGIFGIFALAIALIVVVGRVSRLKRNK